MKDKILISNCRIPVHVGITEEERKPAQEIIVDVEMSINLEKAARTDDLNTTVDYAVICEQIWGIAQEKPYSLIETIAGRITESILSSTLVNSVRVRVSKPAAIRHLGGALAAVEIERHRGL